jgi:dTMP kinase
MTTAGKFISLEGIEGAGKSTALNFIKNYLLALHHEVVLTREPGGTELAEQLRNIALHPISTEEITPQTELLLMFAGRAQHLKHCILPALTAGKWVVSDRFIDATYAYQGGGRGMDQDEIHKLDKWIVNQTYPDLTLLLDIDPVIGFERAEKRGKGRDRIEQEKLDFFVRVRQAYLLRAQQDPSRIKVIDAAQPLLAVEKQIKEVLDRVIK